MSKKNIIGLVIGSIASITAVILIVLALTGAVSNNSENTVKANELYAELNNSPNKIEVEMQDGYAGTFTVEEADKIEQIYTLVMSLDYYYGIGTIPPGSNIYLKFIYADNKTVSFSSRCITLDGRQYFADSYHELDNLLISMGNDSGLISER